MDEDEMKDKILQDLMTAMDDMNVRKPEEKRADIVAESSENPNVDEVMSPEARRIEMPKRVPVPQGPYQDPDRNKVMEEIEGQSPSGDRKISMADEEEELPKGFSSYVRSRRRG